MVGLSSGDIWRRNLFSATSDVEVSALNLTLTLNVRVKTSLGLFRRVVVRREDDLVVVEDDLAPDDCLSKI